MPFGYQVKIRSDNFLIVKKAPPELHQFESSHILFLHFIDFDKPGTLLQQKYANLLYFSLARTILTNRKFTTNY